MSIVICIVDRNKQFFMAADKRAVSDIIHDSYQKIYKIKERVYFGMTGIAEAGHEILKIIQRNSNLSTSELVDLVDSAFQPNSTMLTIMIAGQNENGDFFTWQKNQDGEISIGDISEEKITFSISTNDHLETFQKYLIQQLRAGVPIVQAIPRTIAFASRIDDNISPTHTMHIIEHQ